MTRIVPIATIAAAAVDALLDRAFGPGRHTRTAYRVRAGTDAIPELSFAALDAEGALAGSIQCWPAALHGGGAIHPLVMIGPVAVEPALQGEGIGGALMAQVLAEAGDAAPLMLIGDPGYYGRFGFSAEATGGWQLPGPFEAHRLLARGTGVPAGVSGSVGPWLPLPAAVA